MKRLVPRCTKLGRGELNELQKAKLLRVEGPKHHKISVDVPVQDESRDIEVCSRALPGTLWQRN